MRVGAVFRARVAAAGVVVVLAGCGGGGGGDASSPSVSLTALGMAGDMPLGSPILGAPRELPMALVPTQALARVLQRVQAASAPREHAQALVGPIVQRCAAGGSASVSLDDRDNNSQPSVGDVMTLAFDQCRQTTSETLNGSVAVTYTRIDTSPSLAAGFRMTFAALSVAATGRAMTIGGSLLVEATDLTGPLGTLQLTVDAPMSVTTATALYSDTVTLRSGFEQRVSHDATVASPIVGGPKGRAIVSVNGVIDSTAAGGALQLSTEANSPIVSYDAEGTPRSGVLRLTGRQGSLLLTVLSAQSVRLDLDADGNGSIDSTTTVSWTWLL